MVTLLTIFLIVDVIIAAYLFRQAFVVRSNMNRKYKTRFFLMVPIIGGSVLLKNYSTPLACLLAGVPAGAAILFAVAMGVGLYLQKGPWR